MSDEQTRATDERASTEALATAATDRADGAADDGEVTPPIIIDLGKQRRRVIKQLARGEGPLVHEIDAIARDVRAELGADANGKILVPLVIICRHKRKRASGFLAP